MYLFIIISFYDLLQLIQAGLRELEEETGLHIQPTQCEGQQVHILSLWEVSYIYTVNLCLASISISWIN